MSNTFSYALWWKISSHLNAFARAPQHNYKHWAPSTTDICFLSSGGQKSKTKVSAGLFSPQASLLGVQSPAFSQGPPMAVKRLSVSRLPLLFGAGTAVWLEQDPTDRLHFNLIASLESLFPNAVTSRGAGGQDFSLWIGNTIQPITMSLLIY